ncbi:hypothetical protein [Microlunatus sp. GCM10028923]|uniref:hypothetical protein n=1 Tax=Microlunatus sp. GCM10028923 TaxID=3273400 RepID=UPI00361C0B4E
MTTHRDEPPVGGLPGFPLPPRYPPLDASTTTQALLHAWVRSLISADRVMIMAVLAVALCWAFPISTVAGIAVVVLRPRQLRLIDWYAAYFPGGFPGRRMLDVAWALAVVGLSLSSVGWMLMFVWIAQQGLG